MRSRYQIHNSGALYFITSTIVEWIPVFTTEPYFTIITESLGYCRAHKQLKLFAYVILDNHLHLIVDAPDLAQVLQSFKRHTATAIVHLAETGNRAWLLNQFAYYRKKYKSTSQHQVWQEGFHPQRIDNNAMLNQKIDYIHDNPVRRGLVSAPEHWRYSSARNYVLEDQAVLEIDALTWT